MLIEINKFNVLVDDGTKITDKFFGDNIFIHFSNRFTVTKIRDLRRRGLAIFADCFLHSDMFKYLYRMWGYISTGG